MQLNKFSSRITQPRSQGASQAMLYGTGMTEEDMNKAQVGIASVWYEGNTCNMHLLDLAEKVKQGTDDAGLVGLHGQVRQAGYRLGVSVLRRISGRNDR
jgi:dihydroxy-acid dehydratase